MINRLKGKLTAEPIPAAPKPEDASAAKKEEKNHCWLVDDFKWTWENEAKFSYIKELKSSVKSINKNTWVPSVNFTNLFFYDPLYIGINLTFEKGAPKLTKAFEALLGVKPTESQTIFLKQ